MKTLTIKLPDDVYDNLQIVAKDANLANEIMSKNIITTYVDDIAGRLINDELQVEIDKLDSKGKQTLTTSLKPTESEK